MLGARAKRRTLITIPFSHYCEKARWALDRASMTFVEEMHLPFFHAVPAWLASGQHAVPVLITPHGAISDSTRILLWIDSMLPEERRLFPSDRPHRAAVERWESRFDDDLGPHARRWGYSHLLPERSLALSLLGRHASAFETRALARAWPIATRLMNDQMKITPDSAARSLEKVRSVFADVSAAVSDGRSYLEGDRFTAADLTFAAFSAPVLLPGADAKWLGGREEAPRSMHAVIDELRATPAGRYAMRVYERDR